MCSGRDFATELRAAWQEGEARPTSKSKEKARRGRRRPDPFVTVTTLVHEWFEAEPWRTSRELIEQLQEVQPGRAGCKVIALSRCPCEPPGKRQGLPQAPQ
jgi:hypothetical protein